MLSDSPRLDDGEWVVEIRRPGDCGSRYIKPAVRRVDLQRWCDEFNKDAKKSVTAGPIRFAVVIHRSEVKEQKD